MKLLYRVLITMFVITTTAFAYNPKVYIRVNSDTIYSGEDLAVTLIAEASENSKISFPKLKNLNGYSFKNRSHLVKRKLVDDSTTQIYLQAKQTFVIRPTKSFTIEKIKVNIDGKVYTSKPHKIEVLHKNSNQAKQQEESKPSEFKVVMNVNKKEIVQGDYAIVTVKIFQPLNIDIADAKYTKPSFKGFDVLPLKPKPAIEKDNYGISELKYVIMPKNSGNFTIEPAWIEFTQGMAKSNSATFGFFGGMSKSKKILSNSIKLKVNKPPKSVDMIGNYIIKSEFKSDKFYKSTPIKYTVTIEGEGNLEGVELPKIEVNGLTVYDKEAKVNRIIRNGKLYSILKKDYTFVSTKDFDIPQMSIEFYNPNTQQLVTKTLEPISVKLKAKKSILELLNKEKTKTAVVKEKEEQHFLTNKDAENINNILFDQNYYKSKYLNYNATYKYILTLIIGIILGILSTIYAPMLLNLFRKKEFKSSLYSSYEEALNILYPHTNDNYEVERMVKRLYEVVNGNKEIKIDNKRLDRVVKMVLKNTK